MQSLGQVGKCFIKLFFYIYIIYYIYSVDIFTSPSRFQAGLDRMYPSSNLSVTFKVELYNIFLLTSYIIGSRL